MKIVIPECLYRGSMISVGLKLDSRSESLREWQFCELAKDWRFWV